MGKTFKLEALEAADIKEFDLFLNRLSDYIDNFKKFNLGDVLIAWGGDEESKQKLLNSYGVPRKFQVVYVSKQGIPYIAEISTSGNILKPLISMIPSALYSDKYAHIEPYDVEISHQFYDAYFELDPHYVDCMILNVPYNPWHDMLDKKSLHIEITEFNKSVRVKTSQINDIANFFMTLNQGDTIWTSNSNHFIITNIKLLSKQDLYKNGVKMPNKNRVKGPFVPVLTIVDPKNKIKTITPDFFHKKMLYSQRPRSYKELRS